MIIDLRPFKIPKKLPGKEAHLKLAPEHRVSSLTIEQTPPANARESAVLVVLTPKKVQNVLVQNILEWSVLLIKRNTYHGTHSGQIAFPGGKCEEYDADHIATACREAFEEVGVKRDEVNILGHLTKLYVPPSNFTIYPVLAIDKGIQEFRLEPREVTEFMQIPLKMFDPKNAERCRVLGGPNEWVYAPGYVIDGNIIWGATAMILSELYEVADEIEKIVLANLINSSSKLEL